MKDKKNIMVFVIIAVVAIFLIKPQLPTQAVVEGTTLTRSMPTEIEPNTPFEVIYSTSETNPNNRFGVSIREDVSGTCFTNPEFKLFWIHDVGDSLTETVEFTSGIAGTTCSFASTGDYKYDNWAISPFGVTNTVNVCDVACYEESECGTDVFVGATSCSVYDTSFNNIVYQDFQDFNCNNVGKCASSCTDVTNSAIKQDCNIGTQFCDSTSNDCIIVGKIPLQVYGNDWVAGTLPREVLGYATISWSSQ